MTKKIDLLIPLFKLPDPTPTGDPVELDESEVVWSDENKSETSDTTTQHSVSPPPPPLSPRRLHRGLSAALAGNSPVALMRRKSALSAARIVPPTPIYGGVHTRFPMSAPVNVPVWPKKAVSDEVEDELDEDGEEMVPPHVMVARSHVTTFSVFEGVGRTLKGRDMRRVRNTVFQKTGFLD